MRFSSENTYTKNGLCNFLYDKANHLGNVLTVVSDKKIPRDENADGITDYFLADVISSTDYYPGHGKMPGRNFNSSEYRYGGANGQEKDDEIFEGAYTAEYWEYDSRIMRRWNPDPVTKPWQSDYSCYSGNPIWRVDPDGDDDFFDSKGNYLRSDKQKTHNIKIETAKGLVNFSQLNTTTQKTVISNVATYYAKQLGIKGVVAVADAKKKTSSENPAFTVTPPGTVTLNSKGGIAPLLNDANNLISVLKHEKDHQDGKGEFGFEHLNVYLRQMQDVSFKGTTSDFQSGIIGSFEKKLEEEAQDEYDINGGLTQTNKALTEFNKLSKVTGVTLSVSVSNINLPDAEHKVTIIATKASTTAPKKKK